MIFRNNLEPGQVGLGWETARASVVAGLRAAFSPRVDQAFIQSVEERLT